jgi:cytochrome c553
MSKTCKCANLLFTGLLIASALVACSGQKALTNEEQIEKGRELATGCHSCHSPKIFTDHGPVPDSSRVLSGHPEGLDVPEVNPAQMATGWLSFNDHLTCWVGPWGVSFAKNLTPDTETGLGSWSEEVFVRVMRTGRHLGDPRLLAQPMPWSDLSKLSDDDLKAIFAYLQSVKPVRNQVPVSIPIDDLKAKRQ